MAYIAGLICECDELIASGIVVVIDHCLSKAMYDGLGDIYFLKLVSNVDGLEGNIVTFALWLLRGEIACNDMLLIIRAKRCEIHRLRDL